MTLLPCPFCNCENIREIEVPSREKLAECQRCDALAKVGRWNQRVREDELIDEIKKLVEGTKGT